jgi:putative ABC transport system permease protein
MEGATVFMVWKFAIWSVQLLAHRKVYCDYGYSCPACRLAACVVTSLIIDESRNTISLLKVLGYRRKELAKLILNSSTPAVFIGFWLGLPLMLVFGNYTSGYVADMINMSIPMIVNPLYVLISFVLIFAVYEITKWLCGRKLAKISMSDALKAGTE